LLGFLLSIYLRLRMFWLIVLLGLFFSVWV